MSFRRTLKTLDPDEEMMHDVGFNDGENKLTIQCERKPTTRKFWFWRQMLNKYKQTKEHMNHTQIGLN